MVSQQCGFFHESTNDKSNLNVLSEFDELNDLSLISVNSFMSLQMIGRTEFVAPV